MTNSELLKKYILLQKDIMFDELIDIPSGVIGVSKTDSSSFWNQAIVNNPLTSEEIKQIEEILKSKNRVPAIYFEANESNKKLIDSLEKDGFQKSFEDSWNFYNLDEVDSSRFDEVRKVETEEDLKIFLTTFDKCYQDNDPQNPYGNLGDYLEVAEKAWRKHHESNRLEYFIVFDKDKPVAVSTLTNFENLGYISNVGSIQEVRGQGYGKIATLVCVDRARKRGASEIFLLTEEGHYPNEFYKRIGFETKFKATCYIK